MNWETDKPRVWTRDEIEQDSLESVRLFVEHRLSETHNVYEDQFQRRGCGVVELFQSLFLIDPSNPDLDKLKQILSKGELYDALRYVTSPPVSKDDLGVLITGGYNALSQNQRRDDEVLKMVIAFAYKFADPYRFPWIKRREQPADEELARAVLATTTLLATQGVQTERRGHGKSVERRIDEELIKLGFRKTKIPKKSVISAPIDYPDFPHFYGECILYTRKVDHFIALPNKTMIAVEAKFSGSALNGKKRLNNDTAAKARQIAVQAGQTIVNVAVISGVFNPADVAAAQEDNLYIVWLHKLDEFVQWIRRKAPSSMTDAMAQM